MAVKKKQTRVTITEEEKQRFALEAEVRRLKGRIADKNKALKNQDRQIRELDKALDAHLAIKSKVQPLKIRPKFRSKKSASETTPIAMLSDWHVEETVNPETIQGLNEFNLEVADQRINELFCKVLKLVQIRRGHTQINEMILALMGDFITGYIHEELVESNSLSPIQAVQWVKRRLIAGIDYLLEAGEFSRICIPCVIGNHGRTTTKSRISTARHNSFEFGMYLDLADFYAKENRVKFIVPDAYFAFVEVYGRKVRFHHGDHLRYNGGVGGITIPVNKAIAAWNRSNQAWLDLFGHWHTFLDHGNWVCNPSLIGYNAYAQSIKADYQPAGQNLLFIEKDKGKIATEPVYLK